MILKNIYSILKLSWETYRKVKYLKYLIGCGQIRPQIEKIIVIQMVPSPMTKRQMRSIFRTGVAVPKVCFPFCYDGSTTHLTNKKI